MSESEHADMRLVIKKNIYQRCLDMYTYEEWSRKSEELKSRLNPLNRDHERFWSEYMRNRALVEPDGKVGRISIPKKLSSAVLTTRSRSGPRRISMQAGFLKMNSYHSQAQYKDRRK